MVKGSPASDDRAPATATRALWQGAGGCRVPVAAGSVKQSREALDDGYTVTAPVGGRRWIAHLQCGMDYYARGHDEITGIKLMVGWLRGLGVGRSQRAGAVLCRCGCTRGFSERRTLLRCTLLRCARDIGMDSIMINSMRVNYCYLWHVRGQSPCRRVAPAALWGGGLQLTACSYNVCNRAPFEPRADACPLLFGLHTQACMHCEDRHPF